jgi:hypothetical protein
MIHLAILLFMDMKLTRNGISFPSTGYSKQMNETSIEEGLTAFAYSPEISTQNA